MREYKNLILGWCLRRSEIPTGGKNVIVTSGNVSWFYGSVVIGCGNFTDSNSFILDQAGRHELHVGRLDLMRGEALFPKRRSAGESGWVTTQHQARMDHKTRCWIGTFSEDDGEGGITRFVICDQLPLALLSGEFNPNALYAFIDELRDSLPLTLFEGRDGHGH